MRRAAVVTLALLALAACGTERGPSASPAASPAASSRASSDAATGGALPDVSFLRAVNDACREYAEKDEALDFPEALDDYVPFMQTFIANAAELDAKLSELTKSGAPEGFDRYVADNRRQTDVLRAALPDVEAAVRADDIDRADAVIDDAIDDFNRIADALEPYSLRHGLTDCASEPEDAQEA